MIAKEFVWADILRIFAIFSIVFIHVIDLTSVQNGYTYLLLLLANTCVPILVMLSGALLLGKKETYQEFYRKRLNRVAIPWISWTFIFSIILCVYYKNISLASFVHYFHLIFMPLFWFIPMIFCLYLLTPLLRKLLSVTDRREVWYLIGIWALAVIILPFVRDTAAFPLIPDNGLVRQVAGYLGYFILGYQLTKEKFSPAIYFLFSTTIILAILSVSGLVQTNGGYFNPFITLVSIAVFEIIFLSERKFQKYFSFKLKKVISIVSGATFGIYFFHFLLIGRDSLPNLRFHVLSLANYPNITLLVTAVGIFLVSLGIILIIQRIPKLGRILS